MVTCPYCESTEVEELGVIDVIEQIEDDPPLCLAIYLYVCLECGKKFDDEGLYIGEIRRKIL